MMAFGKSALVASFVAGAALSALVAAAVLSVGAEVSQARGPGAEAQGDAPAVPPRTTSTPAPVSVPRAERPRADAGGALPDVALPAGLRGVEMSDDEAAFLRAALDAERKRREGAVIRPEDDGLKIMERYVTDGADVAALVADFDAMRAHIRVPAGPVRSIAASGDRTPVDLTKDLGDAQIVEFGPGTFVLGNGDGQWNVRRSDLAALEIRGAGMDRTKLIGPGWAFLCSGDKANVQNLVLRDLTIDGSEQGQIILDARGGISAALERVRLAGWQVAGHAAPLGVSGNAFLACRECEVAGPGAGYVLSLRGMALATFDACRFIDAESAFTGPGGTSRAAVVSVQGCTFDGARLADSRIRGDKMAGVQIDVRGGTVAFGASSLSDEKRRAQWGAQYAASVEGVTFTAAQPLFPFSEMVRAADLAAAGGLRDIVAIDAYPGARGAPVEFDFYLYDREKDTVVRKTRRLVGPLLEEVTKDPRRGMRGRSVRSAAEIDGLLPIPELLRRMDVAADESFTQIEIRALSPSEGRQITWLVAQTPGGAAPVVIDARTAEIVQRR